VEIRPERSNDVSAISVLVSAAFATARHTNGREQLIVSGLRDSGSLTISLVAEEGGRLVGHIAFSPVSVTDGSRQWHGLGPVAVEPSSQGMGTGSGLMRSGLAALRRLGSAGCVVLGNPSYYSRFGFRRFDQLRYVAAPAEYFLALPFGEVVPSGEVAYHASFEAEA